MNIPEELILDQMEMGPMGNFVYFIGDRSTKEIAVVDLSGEINSLLNMAKEKKYQIKALLLTHSHYDHTWGLKEFLEQVPIPLYFSKEESRIFNPDVENVKLLEDGDKIKIGNIEIDCILTPGHAPGAMCYRYKNILLTGDTLFVDGCGRCDLSGGDPKAMYHTLYEILMRLPDDTRIFPGHAYGPSSSATIGEQKKTNHFLTCRDEKEFLSERMGI